MLAARFLAAGASVTVWNRTEAKALPLIELGARLAQDPVAALTASPVTVVCAAVYDTAWRSWRGQQSPTSLAGRL